MNDVKCGDIFRDKDGKLWKVIGYCESPTVTMEAIEADPPPNPSYSAMAGAMQQYQPAPYLTLTHKRLSGGIGGQMWDGFKRIFSES